MFSRKYPYLDDSKENGQTSCPPKRKTKEPQWKSSEVLCVLVSIFLVKIDLNLDKGFGFA